MTEQAWENHPDATDEVSPGVNLRLSGMAELGGDIVPLTRLKRICKMYADNGCDPIANGTVEVGLFLEIGQYEELKEYAKSLPIFHGKRRKARS